MVNVPNSAKPMIMPVPAFCFMTLRDARAAVCATIHAVLDDYTEGHAWCAGCDIYLNTPLPSCRGLTVRAHKVELLVITKGSRTAGVSGCHH